MTGFHDLADIEAFESTRLVMRDLPASTYRALQHGAEIDPHHPALIFLPDGENYQQANTLSYAELLAQITQAANLFHHLGVQPDDVVSLLLPNLPETHFAIWGGQAVGTVNPINPLLEAETIAEILNAAEAKVLVTMAPEAGGELWRKVEAVLALVPTLDTLLLVGGDRGGEREERVEGVRAFNWNAATAAHSGDGLAFRRVMAASDVASYFHTGGTTGTPKLAGHTHGNEVADAWMTATCLSAGPADVFFCGLPLFHVNGVIVTGLVPWFTGATVVLATAHGYRGQGVFSNFWKIVEHYGVTFFSGVPTIYSALLDIPVDGADLSSLAYALCGAAPMPVEVFRAFEERTGVRILEGYGLTESTCVSSLNPASGDRRVGSIGLRLPYQEMKTAVLEDGRYVRDCEIDEVGAVLLRGPNVFAGYKDEVHNRHAWIVAEDGSDAGGPWLDTGDLGRCDEDGYFWLTGRSKELIIRGGHNLHPKQIEEPLQDHPAVALVAAVGRPDARLGEVPVAYVQLVEGGEATEDELLVFARQHIGERAAVPKRIRVVDALPLTAVGKIFKPELVWRETEDVLAGELGALEGTDVSAVAVSADKRLGTFAEVELIAADTKTDPGELRETAAQVLGKFAIQHRVTVHQRKDGACD